MAHDTPDARGQTIDDLLHDAERAKGGAYFARMMGDGKSAKELDEKAKRLFAAANDRDPQHLDPAWSEL
jgi:hypothetical protein